MLGERTKLEIPQYRNLYKNVQTLHYKIKSIGPSFFNEQLFLKLQLYSWLLVYWFVNTSATARVLIEAVITII